MPDGNVGNQGSAPHDQYDRSSQASGRGDMSYEYDRSNWFGDSVRQPAVPLSRPGPYIGRGPRGYYRSDDRIWEDVCERLTEHGQLDARDIEVKVDNAEVTLVGTVDSRQAKRIAEDTAELVPWVKQVHNQLRVGFPSESETSPGLPDAGRSTRGGA
jgi:hypothetical protein